MANPHELHGHNPPGADPYAHIQPVGFYIKTFVILLVLLIATIGAAQFQLGPLNLVVAMIIAGGKAAVVVMNFMNVRFNSRLVWIWAACGFVWLSILFITLTDYVTRDWIRSIGW